MAKRGVRPDAPTVWAKAVGLRMLRGAQHDNEEVGVSIGIDCVKAMMDS